MVAHVNAVAFSGIDVLPIDVQVAVASGLPAFTIVGLPDKAVGESRERVCAALTAIGLGLLTAMGVIAIEDMAQYAALGELGLDGSIAPRWPVFFPLPWPLMRTDAD